jgi:hypothetical protein
VPEKLKFARPHAYFSRGLYHDQLLPYFQLFPREQILCLRYEDITEKPEFLARRIHTFLGVKPRPTDTVDMGVINPSTKDGQSMPLDLRAELVSRYAEPNRRLAQLLGSGFEVWKTS